MSNKNEVFEYLIDQLRQKAGNNPYKQQCEDLAHEVRSLKNQLRDMSEVVDELLGTITLMHGDVEAFKLTHKRAQATEQSGYHKEDTQECLHSSYYVVTDGSAPFGTKVCRTCLRCF